MEGPEGITAVTGVMHPAAQAIPASLPPGQPSHPGMDPSEWAAAAICIAMLVACATLIADPTAMARTTSTVTMRASRRMSKPYTASPGAVHARVSQSALYTSMVT